MERDAVMSRRLLIIGLLAPAALMARERLLLAGVVLDTSGAAAPGTSLAAMNEQTGLRYGVMSGLDGVYALTLPAGSYKVTARKPGFCTVAKLNVVVGAGEAARADFTLPVGNFRETITVSGAPGVTNTDNASVGGFAGRRWIETLPLNGRGILTLVDLAPGVLATPASSGEAGQFTVNGQRPSTNYFTVDGVSANNTVTGGLAAAQFAGWTLPGMTAFGSTQSLSSLEALEEVKIETSTFAPEFGRMPGAHVALTTRSGGDQFHGSLFYTFRHERMAASDWLANSLRLGRAPSRLHHGGASLGGPLRTARTYFFLSAESLRLVHSATWSMITPSVRARRGAPDRLHALLAAFPLPTGPEALNGISDATAQAIRSASMRSLNARIDHALTSGVSLFGVYQQTPSTADFGFLQVDYSEFNSRRVVLGAVASSARMTNELRVGFSQAPVRTQSTLSADGGAVPVDLRQYLPVTDGADASLYGISIGGIGQFMSGDGGRNGQGQFNIGNTLSFRAGGHSLRAGLEYVRISPERLSASARVTASYGSVAGMLQGDPPLVARTLLEPAVSRIEVLSAFFQDTWKPHSRVSVTYGARWELTPAPSYSSTIASYPFGSGQVQPVPVGLGTLPAVGVVTNFPGTAEGSGAAGPAVQSYLLWPTRYGQFAPRIGVAYRASERWVLRAGAGLFYDTGFSAALDAINGYAFNRRELASGGESGMTFVSIPGFTSATGLELPRTWQWNVAAEHDFGRAGVLSATYVGAAGRRLLRREGNLLFRGEVDFVQLAPSIGTAVATNNGESRYDGLQFHYRRQWHSGFRANASYTLSISSDNGSWDSAVYLVMPELGFTAARDRGPSSFDIGHSLTAAVSYPMPFRGNRILRGWSADSMIRLRSAFPIDIRGTENLLGLGFDNLVRPSLVAGQPLWLRDSNVPGGRRLNPAAFSIAADGSQGALGRNAIRGFGMGQLDISLRRSFLLSERSGLEFRAEAFNVTNRASAGDPVPYLQDARFGRSISMLNLMMGSGAPHSGLTPAFQAGGPRTVQLQLRLRF